MTFLALFHIALLRKLRDPVTLALSVCTAPAFVLVYALVFQTSEPTEPTLTLITCTQSAPDTASVRMMEHLRVSVSTDSSPIQTFTTLSSCENLLPTLQDNPQHNAGLVLQPTSDQLSLTLHADATSPTYAPLVLWLQGALGSFGPLPENMPPPPALNIAPLGLSADLRPFDTYVPSLLVFSVLMLIFSSALTTSRELESGTFERLLHTPLHPALWFFSLTSTELLIGSISLGLSFGAASLVGFQHSGSLAVAFAFAVPAMLSCVGIGLLCATFARTTPRSFLTSSVAMFILLLFSGLLFPRPALPLGTLFDTPIDALDVLPTTPLTTVWKHTLILGSPASSLLYELALLLTLALTLSTLGPLLFWWRTSKQSAL